MKRAVIRILFIAFLPIGVMAQDSQSTIEQLIADIFEQYAEEAEDDIDFEAFYEDLIYFSQNPINLNTATREELERLPFLTVRQVENILAYRYSFGKIQTLYELQLIEGLDMTDIRRMLPFVYVGEARTVSKKINWRDVGRYGKHDFLLRFDAGLEERAGFQKTGDTEADARKYQGEPFYHSLRYKFRYSNRISAGFTAEKDLGEPFFNEKNKGYDFLSASVQLNDFGVFKNIVVGDFRAAFGQGLVLRQQFAMGKSSYVLNVSSRTSGLKRYTSTDEYNFFRGAGATVKLRNWEITAFYSNKNIDGDSTGGFIASINKTGLHRTETEINRKKTTNQQVFGTNITFTSLHWQIGITATQTILDLPLIPDKSIYNFHYFEGKEQTAAGIHYKGVWNKFNFFGETALTNNFALATLNGCSFSPISIVDFVVLQRYYSPQHDVFFSTAFGESSRINNEQGIYIGAEIRPFRRWKIAAYADSYQFPWARFGVDLPSLGDDYLLQADFAPSRRTTMFWRFKHEEKMRNLSSSTETMAKIVPFKKWSLRYNLAHSVGQFSFRTVLEGNITQTDIQPVTYGVTALQDFSYTFNKIPLRVDFRYQFFDATAYDNRIYAYEKDILYAFSIPMFYGIGSRYYVNLKYTLNKNCSFWLKLSQTIYSDDREYISSGNEMIEGNRKTDMRFLFRWTF